MGHQKQRNEMYGSFEVSGFGEEWKWLTGEKKITNEETLRRKSVGAIKKRETTWIHHVVRKDYLQKLIIKGNT